jgi:hypothetical protein
MLPPQPRLEARHAEDAVAVVRQLRRVAVHRAAAGVLALPLLWAALHRGFIDFQVGCRCERQEFTSLCRPCGNGALSTHVAQSAHLAQSRLATPLNPTPQSPAPPGLPKCKPVSPSLLNVPRCMICLSLKTPACPENPRTPNPTVPRSINAHSPQPISPSAPNAPGPRRAL